ncbi:MAG: RNA methyltransferase [Candidatus Nanohaloarchaea archaeon]
MRKIVLVEPEVPENTGFIARVCANFDFDLRPVDPCFNLSEARQTARNCQEKLRNAEIYGSVEKAVEDLEYVVGTKPDRGRSVHAFEPREETSLMIGRESSGLSNEELDLCDAVVHIPTSGYSSLNQSHAAAVVASRFSESDSEGMTSGQKSKIRQLAPDTVAEKLVASNPSRSEAGSLISELRDISS